MSTLTAKDVNGLGDPIRELLERLPGRVAEKQEFFNNRFHLRASKANYNALWDGLGAPGNVARASYIFDYARLKLPPRALALINEAVTDGQAARAASDPAITDLLLYQNGKPRRLGRLLAEYFPTDSGKTVLAGPRQPKPRPVSTTAPTVLVAPQNSVAVKRPPPTQSTTTTQTSDGEAGGWWRDQKRYETIRRINRGGMALVYLVKEKANGREFAAKVIDPNHRKDEEYQARFVREVRAQSQLRHANILRILNHGRDYYICEVCDGSLSDLLKKTLPPRAELLSLFDQACAGVEAAHRGRVLHRDIKPSNLLRRKTGALVVADFGLCKIDSSDFTTMTSTGVGGGTIRYGAPEQWRNMKDADHRADVYSLGVVLQDLMLGSVTAPAGDRTSLANARIGKFVSVIEKATALVAAERHGSVAELRAAARAAGA